MMQLSDKIPWYAEENRSRYLAAATGMVAVIAIIDWLTNANLGLGFLYFFPLALASAFLARAQILSLALVFAALREMFAYFPPGAEKWPRIVFVYVAYAVVGLLVRDMVVYRRAAVRHLRELEREIALRHQTDEQLEALINSSPAGIVTLSDDRKIVMSNEAAHQIFGVAPGALTGQAIGTFLPLLEQVEKTEAPARTLLECHGRRANGEGFLAQVCVSTFSSAAGSALAAIIVDYPENSRERDTGSD